MTNSNGLDALFADAEMPFGHPGRKFDDTPAHLEDFDDRYEPPPVDPPEESMIHYGPGDRPLCGNESPFAIYTDEPGRVAVARTAWSWSPRTCRTRTPGTGATVYTASGRSPPPVPSSGVAWSGIRALTAGNQDGNDQQGRRRPSDPETHPTKAKLGTENATDNFRTLPN